MKKQAGLTLIELLVAMVIFGILSSVAIPAFQDLFGRKNLDSVAKLYIQSLRMARAEAVRRSKSVTVSPSTNGNNWANGWTVTFINNDGAQEVIRSFSAIPAGASFTSATYNDTSPLIFLPNGQANNVGSLDLSYNDCDRSPYDIEFNVLISGIVNYSRTDCGSN